MTGLQHASVEYLALKYGRVCVREGYHDGIVRATVPGGAHFLIADDDYGTITEQHDQPDHSIDWSHGVAR